MVADLLNNPQEQDEVKIVEELPEVPILAKKMSNVSPSVQR